MRCAVYIEVIVNIWKLKGNSIEEDACNDKGSSKTDIVEEM